MGKRSKQRKSAALYDSDDDSVSSSSTAMSELTVAPDTIKNTVAPDNTEETLGGNNELDDCLDALYEKRGATREKALTTIVDGFRTKLQHEFVANKRITILHQCLNSFKRGSIKEINLASLAIGLLAITVGFEDGLAHEILEESIPPLTQALKSASESLKISSILDCLAIINFIGGSSPEETERSMQIMWQFIDPKLGPNVVAKKPTPAVLTAAISAWAFLLTTMEGCKINSKDWQESISYFSSLLDKDDRSVRIAAGEAIALIFEIGSLDKFYKVAKGSNEGNKSADVYIHLQGLRGKILNQVRDLSAEAGGKGSTKKDLNSQRNLFRDVLEFLEDGYSPETSVKIGADFLNTSTWSQLIQLNFLKRFLAGGFAKHMQDNEVLHDVFGFAPKKTNLSKAERPLSDLEKRMFRSPNSFLNKSRTQILNKKRMMSQGRNAGHYSVGAGDEE